MPETEGGIELVPRWFFPKSWTSTSKKQGKMSTTSDSGSEHSRLLPGGATSSGSHSSNPTPADDARARRFWKQFAFGAEGGGRQFHRSQPLGGGRPRIPCGGFAPITLPLARAPGASLRTVVTPEQACCRVSGSWVPGAHLANRPAACNFFGAVGASASHPR